MRFNTLLLMLLFGPSLALADIYKTVDADGHVTYSSSPMKGARKIILSPQQGQDEPVQRRSEQAPRRSDSQGFPTVSEQTQKNRDDKRRQILEDELVSERTLLGKADQNLKSLEAQRGVNQQEKRKALNSQVELHQRNIDALNVELSKLK